MISVKYLKYLLIILPALLANQGAGAQSLTGRQIELAERLHSLSDKYVAEMTYIQTSKDIYETGEDLWFKVYVLDSRLLVPSPRSSTLYVQFMAEGTRRVVWQEYYAIENGISPGHIYLNPGIPDGNYLLTAFTAYSLARDNSEIRSLKRIRVVKDINAPFTDEASTKEQTSRSGQNREQETATPPPDTGQVIFTAFPEGGEMVAGLPGVVAFKATDRTGVPVDVKGVVYEDNEPVIEIESTHQGMGKFFLRPLPGKKYTVKLSQPDSRQVYNLAEPLPSGIKMTVARTDRNHIYIVISKTDDIAAQDYYLRVQSRGIVYGMATGRLERETGIRLPVDELPAGIAEITLFGEQLQPMAERLVFVNGYRRLYITSTVEKAICETREKNLLKISVRNEAGQPVSANLGVTIYDRIFQNRLDSSGIVTHLMLGAELKGRIYNPAYYFSGDYADREKALDLLMLTQGWRKYVWNETNLGSIAGAPPVIGDEIAGRIDILAALRLRRNKPQESAYLMAFSPNVNEKKMLIIPDSGNLFLVTPELLNEWKGDYVYFKPYGPENSQPRIVFDDPFAAITTALRGRDLVYSPVPAVVREKVQPQILFDARVIKIPEVTVNSTHKTLRGKYMGILDSLAKFAAPDYVCRHNILNCINHPNEPDNRKPVEGQRYQMRNSSGQMVTIVYKRPEYSEEELMKLNNLYRVKAYYGNRIFFQPDYETWTGGEEPDFRNTLVWEPVVVTGENGEATVEFYASDVNTVFTVRIEGISSDGRPGTGFNTLTVRKPVLRHQ
jgi:hypothetical protein